MLKHKHPLVVIAVVLYALVLPTSKALALIQIDASISITNGPAPTILIPNDSTHPMVVGLSLNPTTSQVSVEALARGPNYAWGYTVQSKSSLSGTYADISTGVHVSIDPASGKTPTLTAWFEAPGYYKIIVDASVIYSDGGAGNYVGPGERAIEVSVVGVSKLQYDNGYGFKDTGVTVGVLPFITTSIKAIPNPVDASFPSGYPHWTGITASGALVSDTFYVASKSPSDYVTLAATCGNTVSANFLTASLELNVNNTPTTQDDYVRVKDLTPCGTNYHQSTPVQATLHYLSATQPTSFTFSSKNGYISFASPTGASSPTTVPTTQLALMPETPLSFDILGEKRSGSIADSKIAGSAQGHEIASTQATVFGFDGTTTVIEGDPAVHPSGDYELVGTLYTTATKDPGPAVVIRGLATVMPVGTDLSAPQLSQIRVGIAQEVTGVSKTVTLTNPTIAYTAGDGYKVTVPLSVTLTIVPNVAPGKAENLPWQDSNAAGLSIYSKPNLDFPKAVEPPGIEAEVDDSPSTHGVSSFYKDFQDPSGNILCRVTWNTLDSVSMFRTFNDYTMVLDDTTSYAATPISEAGWTLNFGSKDAIQHASVRGSGPVANCPSTSTQPANANGRFMKFTVAASGAPTTSYTYPSATPVTSVYNYP